MLNDVLSWINDRYPFKIKNSILDKPWGGFLVIHEDSTPEFIQTFFPNYATNTELPFTPKFLIIAPFKRLSLQIHEKRSEAWKLIYGAAKSIIGNEEIQLHLNEPILVPKSTQHRLIGLENWSVVAEIWIHEYADDPSDENDIIRLQDDFHRI